MRNAKGLINYLNYRAKGDNNCRFQDPQPFASVSQLPAALRLPQKNTPLDFLKHASCGFCDVYRLLLFFVDFRVSGLVFLVSGLEPAKCERCK